MNQENLKNRMSTISVSRCIHLLGGLRAGTGHDGQLIIHPMGTPFRPVPVVTVSISDQKQYVDYFRSIGLDMIGFEKIHTDRGYTHSAWHGWDPDAMSAEEDLNYIWPGLANAYRQEGDPEGDRLSRNVTFGLRAITVRLRDISEAYCAQTVMALCFGHKPGIRTKNLETIDVFLSLNSFLVEMGVLRDYLAAFVAVKRFGRYDITKMAKLRNVCKEYGNDPIARHILKICNRDGTDGWLAKLSGLRDYIVHEAPISSRTAFSGVSVQECIVESHRLPMVELKISLPDSSDVQVDALVHCLELYRKMLKLARYVAVSSGQQPKTIHLTDADLR